MIAIINFGSRKIPFISRALKELGAESIIIEADDFTEPLPKSFSGVILSGSPLLFTQNNLSSYLDKYSFTKEIPIPVLGICFGHQLLGILFGSKVFLGKPVREEIQIKILKNNNLFKDLENNLRMTEDHTEGVTLPKDFILLASSDEYEVEAMKHQFKNIYGVQFHPEVSGEPGKKLFNNFLQICNQ